MNSEVKRRWIEALRSGNYPQGKYSLRNLDDTYDAGGVLCELAVSDGIIPEPISYDGVSAETGGWIYGVNADNDSYSTRVPKAVCEWAGIGWYIVNGRISTMNDYGKTFNEIADYVEGL